MKALKDMIENIINENNDNAKVDFHSYLTEKLKKLNEADSLDSKLEVESK